MTTSPVARAKRVLRQRGARAALAGAADEVRARVELRQQRLRGPQRFVVDGSEHTQLVHAYNRTWRNERTVEIPLALAFLGQHEGLVLELGNVLANYGRTGHTVVDKYEQEPGVLNVDIVDYRPAERFGAIVAISTLEHVGWDEEPRDAAKIPAAVARMRSLLNPSGRLLVTCPLGYNPHLDGLISSGALGPARQAFLARGQGRWSEADEATAFAAARMGPHGGTAIWIAEFSP
jgi:hypothetical protein